MAPKAQIYSINLSAWHIMTLITYTKYHAFKTETGKKNNLFIFLILKTPNIEPTFSQIQTIATASRTSV